nr:hypothetical protein Iba_chr12cCG3420 [Ipomoea batatas]
MTAREKMKKRDNPSRFFASTYTKLHTSVSPNASRDRRIEWLVHISTKLELCNLGLEMALMIFRVGHPFCAPRFLQKFVF